MFKGRSNEDFKTLSASLTMLESFAPASSLITAHLQNVHKLLMKYFTGSENIPKELCLAVSQLPDESIFRLISSPYFAELLLINVDMPNELLEKQIVQALAAEVFLVNPDFNFEYRPKWTIDADVVLDEDVAKKFPALQTVCGIRLNYQSYIHNTGKPGIGGYDLQTAQKHKERIETGKEIIANVSSSALSLVDIFTTAIQFRMNVNHPNVVNSSTHTSIGLIRCENFHSLHNDMPEVVDMLVHESIHQYLHLFEEQLFPFVDVANAAPVLDQRLYPSPWSGNLLDLRSYTHAILVWYGLVKFWSQFLEAGYEHPEVSRKQAMDKLKEAEFGFLKSQSVLDNLGDARKYLTGEFSSTVELLQRQLRDTAERKVV